MPSPIQGALYVVAGGLLSRSAIRSIARSCPLVGRGISEIDT
jgi:hypothetical protein